MIQSPDRVYGKDSGDLRRVINGRIGKGSQAKGPIAPEADRGLAGRLTIPFVQNNLIAAAVERV